MTLVTLLLANPALAEQAVPLVPSFDPPKEPEIAERFQQALAEGLKQGGLTCTAPPTVRAKLGQPTEAAGCFQGACLARAARLFGSDAPLGTARIKTVGKNYEIEVRLTQRGRVVGFKRQRCDICTLAEALRATEEAAKAAAKNRKQPAAAAAAPAQSGAKPTAPAAVQPDEPSSEGSPSTTTAAPGSAEDQPTPWPLWPAIVAAGAGVLGIAVGVPLLSIDGDYTNCEGEPLPGGAPNCRDVYSTAAAGWVLTGTGIAALASSGVLFYLHFRSRGRGETGVAAVSATPIAGGALVGAMGRW